MSGWISCCRGNLPRIVAPLPNRRVLLVTSCEVQTQISFEESCSAYSGELKKLGENVAEMLRYQRTSLELCAMYANGCATRMRRIAQGRTQCRLQRSRGTLGPGFLAHVLTDELCDTSPFLRQ